ncbi:MAG: hypothetical protein AB7G23_20410 [Vicinamibacterales bacterium]
MNKAEIVNWLRQGRDALVAEHNLDANWWPMTTAGDHQARTTAWALSMFIHAARNRCSGPLLTAECHANNDQPLSRAMVLRDWTLPGVREHDHSEVLVDFSVHNWEASSPIQLTGESETHVSHGVAGDLNNDDNDYAWDFYKLLIVPSWSRLFFARVSGRDGASAADRCDTLATTLVTMVDRYGPAFLRPHDELGAAIIPSAKTQREQAVILWSERGRLRRELIGEDLLPPPP